ncbi:MAG TPA: hypothetical protein VMT58_08915, partial [Candidatus Binataceae bacterium]|nr:hypothetical protein [Candidatus Binataceae bacterium]
MAAAPAGIIQSATMALELPEQTYRYEIRRAGTPIAVEDDDFSAGKIRSVRKEAAGSNLYEAEAELDGAASVKRIALRYRRGPFVRKAAYESAEDFIRGNVSAGAGSNVVTSKLGRFREVDAGLVIFRAVTIAHIRARGHSRWTGRVAVIDPATLVASTIKHSCRQANEAGRLWIYEPRMGDREEIEIDAAGRIVRIRDGRGTETVL